MKIEAVIVCKDYGDFLAQTLPDNLQHLDRIVVVTHFDDKETIGLCQKYSVDCVQTNVFHEHGDRFNKGRAINLGLGHLKSEDWILHLDADIVLPHRFRNMLHRAQLNTKFLYGADRANVFGYEHWMRNKNKTVPHYSSRYFVEPPKEFPIGARIVHEEHGYTPIGYFQLFHKSAGKKYPVHQGNAEHTDVLFSCQWTREQRVLLPEIIVYHLDSEEKPTGMGANWNGRKTPRFGSSCGHHHHHHWPYPYCPDELGKKK